MMLFMRDQEKRNEGRREERSELLGVMTSLLKRNGIMNPEQAANFKDLVINNLPKL